MVLSGGLTVSFMRFFCFSFYFYPDDPHCFFCVSFYSHLPLEKEVHAHEEGRNCQVSTSQLTFQKKKKKYKLNPKIKKDFCFKKLFFDIFDFGGDKK